MGEFDYLNDRHRFILALLSVRERCNSRGHLKSSIAQAKAAGLKDSARYHVRVLRHLKQKNLLTVQAALDAEDPELVAAARELHAEAARTHVLGSGALPAGGS